MAAASAPARSSTTIAPRVRPPTQIQPPTTRGTEGTMTIKQTGPLALFLIAACTVDSSHPEPGAGGSFSERSLDAATLEADAALPEAQSGNSDEPADESCGNGALDSGEECDDTAHRQRCPTSQSDCEATRDICWRWRVEGQGCHRKCVHAQGVCEDVLDPRDPHGLLKGCRNECPDDTNVNNSWK